MIIPTQTPELPNYPTTPRPPQSERAHSTAMDCAAEYKRLVEREGNGDSGHALALRRTIDRLVGRYIDGRIVWPMAVREAAGLVTKQQSDEAGRA